MLDPDELADNIYANFKVALQPVLKDVFLYLSPVKSDLAETMAQTVVEKLDEGFRVMADGMADSICTFVTKADVKGTILTTGSPTTQTARLMGGSQITKGGVPNQLKIE
jgi:hypothetical protein